MFTGRRKATFKRYKIDVERCEKFVARVSFEMYNYVFINNNN